MPSLFTQPSFAPRTRQKWIKAGSLLLHAAIFAWLIHVPKPRLLTLVSVALGENGTSVTRLYWSSKNLDESKQSSPDSATERYRHERFSRKLTLPASSKSPHDRSTPEVARTEAQDNSQTQTLSALGHGAQAGLPYGSLRSNLYSGDEIRPALPTATSDPVVYPWQLPDSPGNEVIEITIDERGDIVNKSVLQSLGPDIDTKCLAALENWHFRPATRNGAPIASKQDAVFPFRARG